MSNVFVGSLGIGADCPSARVIVDQVVGLKGNVKYTLINQGNEDAVVIVSVSLSDQTGILFESVSLPLTVAADSDLTDEQIPFIAKSYPNAGIVHISTRVEFSEDLVDSYAAECSFLVRGDGEGGAPPAASELDSITDIAVTGFYPEVLAQMKVETPNSSLQVQSDAALGVAWNRSVTQAELNSNGVPGPFGLLPFIGDIQSPIERRMADIFKRLEPDIAARGVRKFPDATPNGVDALSVSLSEGLALRLAMSELGHDVSQLTFS